MAKRPTTPNLDTMNRTGSATHLSPHMPRSQMTSVERTNLPARMRQRLNRIRTSPVKNHNA
jgi:hypothetical protein